MGNVTHTFVSAIADGADATLVRPSNWNADHEVSAPLVAGDVATKEYVDEVEGFLDYGLSFQGVITAVPNNTHFTVASLIGMGTGFFKPFAGSAYEVYVVEADGAAPEGEQTPVVAYATATGIFQHVAFSVSLAVGDIVLIQHPIIAAIGTKAAAAATGVVTDTDFFMSYIKQLVTELQVADALIDTIEAKTSAMSILDETGGNLTTTGAEQNLYIENTPTGVFVPICIDIDFTNHTAAETVVLRYYKRQYSGGAWVEFDEQEFAGVQDPLGKTITMLPNRYGIKITIEKTGGANKAYRWSVYTEE